MSYYEEQEKIDRGFRWITKTWVFLALAFVFNNVLAPTEGDGNHMGLFRWASVVFLAAAILSLVLAMTSSRRGVKPVARKAS